MSWAIELARIADATEVKRLRLYWKAYSGRMFDTLAGQGPVDRFTGADLYACALLSAQIDPKAGVRLLDDEAERCSGLLRGIPTDVSIRSDRAAEVARIDRQPLICISTCEASKVSDEPGPRSCSPFNDRG